MVIALAVAMALSAGAADAAKIPVGRTYFATAIGLESAYGVNHQCFEFHAEKLCSLDGAICGSWQQTGGAGQKLDIGFELTALVDGELNLLEGLGRLEGSGHKSSLAGTGSFHAVDGNGRGVNFSFAAREVGKEECLALLEENADRDDEVITGSGNPMTEERDVGDFHAIAANGVGQIEIRHGTETSLRITADENLLPILTSEVRNGRLVLGSSARFNTRNAIRYELTVRELDQLLVAGVFGVDATGIDTESFEINVSGVSAVTVAGSVGHQDITVAGVSAYNARDLASRTATVEISGPSAAVVRVSDRLEGHLAGGAVLEYIGNPVINVTVDFVSTLRKIG
jgi:hypothetical protein